MRRHPGDDCSATAAGERAPGGERTDMIITCSGCSKRYNFDEKKLGGRTSGTLRCPSCNTLIKVTTPSTPTLSTPTPSASTAPVGDQTTRLEIDANLVAARPQAMEGQPHLLSGQRVSLAVLEGKNAGTIYPLERPRITLGRSGADIALDDGEISRQHACIEVYGRRIILKDLGSTNGTFVDENKISQVQVENRSEFRIGASRIMLILTQEGTDPGTLT